MTIADDFTNFEHQAQKIVKRTQTIRRQLPINCLGVFDHFVGLVVEALRAFNNFSTMFKTLSNTTCPLMITSAQTRATPFNTQIKEAPSYNKHLPRIRTTSQIAMLIEI